MGKMMAQEAKRMALGVAVLDPTPDCPAKAVSDQQIVADFKDAEAIRRLARMSDLLTYEIEISNIEVLKELQREGQKIFPSPTVLEKLQDKLKQKEFLKNHGLPVPKFRELKVGELSDTNAPLQRVNEKGPCPQVPRELLGKILARFGYPLLLKARRDSYDGRGNLTLCSEQELENLAGTKFLNGWLSKGHAMLEKFVPFKMEISVMVARNLSGELVSFPVVENIHEEHILKKTIAPARISAALAEKAQAIARKAVECLNGVGIFGVEMFVDENDEILINEIAPRPHNSGHYTIDACNHSQFELHLRAILNLPLVQPKLLSPAVMLNILATEESFPTCNIVDDECPNTLRRVVADSTISWGDSSSSYKIAGLHQILSVPGIKLHLYGKKNLRKKRKLGHLVILDANLESAIEKANRIDEQIRVVPNAN